jgi:pimeloyl-ACP methyl ester carboxylesterase
MFKSPVKLVRSTKRRPIAVPTLILWGVEDRFLDLELISPAKLLPWWTPGNPPEVHRIEGAGHFVQNEKPERVNDELVRWLGRP